MIKYVRFVIILAISCLGFIIIDDVYAATANISFDSAFMNSSANTIKLNVSNLTIDYNNYYSLSSSLINTTGTKPLTANIYGFNTINTVDYDYALFNICSFDKFPSSLTFVDSGVFGYSISSTSLHTSPHDGTTDTVYNYCSVIKVDLNGVNSLTGLMQIQFSAPVQIQLSTDFILNKKLYLGKDSDDVITAIEENTKAIEDQIDATKEQTDTIKDSDTSGAGDTAGGFFDNFEDNDYGLSDIVTAPLEFIKSFLTATCVPLTFELPFVKKSMTLPCMDEVYSRFGPIKTVYQNITFGIISYWVCVNTLATVRKFKDPDNDEIEVLDL